MRQPAPAPPAPPDLPALPALPQVPDPGDPTVVATPGGNVPALPQAARAAPRTAQEIAGLREQRRELSNQLTSAQRRRGEVARRLEKARDPVNQNGLQQRLRVLDTRIAQLESDIAETGRLITEAPPALVATSSSQGGFLLLGRDGPSPNAVPVLLFVVIALQLLVFARLRMRRGHAAPAPDRAARESAERLARVEQAVDAIAVEVERVSEGQRFVTKLLAEQRQAPALARADDTLDVVPRQG